MQYRLVIFDFDGVLADSAAWFVGVLDGVADRYGFRKLSPEEIEALRGQSSREVIRQLRIPFWKLPAIAKHMGGLSLEAADDIVLFPGVVEMLRALDRAGATIAIASSNGEATVRRVLGAEAAIIDHFECGSSMFGKASRIRTLLKRSGAAADESILIGDETRDIEAAAKAGVASGAALWGYARAQAFDGFAPTVTFATVAELAAFLAGEKLQPK